MQTSRHHICATQVFEAFDTFEDIGEISSKGRRGTQVEMFEDLALRGTTFEPRDPPWADDVWV